MLAALGTRLREQVGDRAVPARLGGAEIALLQPFDGHLARAEQSMRDLLAAVAGPARVGGVEVEIELSAGVAAGPMHATGGRDLLRCAGEALRRAKATESEVEVYDPAQDIGRDFGPRLLPELIGALERNRIGAWYQPKVELAGGAAVELESQLRWVHPEHGVLDAAILRPLAARAGLTRRLTRVMLAEAVRRCAWWQAGGVRLGVAVDLSTADVLDSRLPYELARLVSEAGVPPGAIQLELAEDLLLVDPGRTRRALNQFRTLGVRLALDHYGRSAPSLTRLRTMPVQELKLDRSFVASVLQSGAGRGGRPVDDQPGPVARHPDRRRRRGHRRPARPGPVVRGARPCRVRRSATRCRRTRWPTGSAPRRPARRRPGAHRAATADRMTAVADQPVRAAGRDGGASRCCRRAPRTGSPTDHPDLALAGRRRARHRRAARLELDHGPPAGAPRRRRAGCWAHRPPAAGAGRWPARPPPTAAPGRPRSPRLLVTAREKLREWGRRYLLAEIAGTLTALAAALTVHALTGSLAPAALAGSVAESLAYYGVILRRTVPRAVRGARRRRPGPPAAAHRPQPARRGERLRRGRAGGHARWSGPG